jgi:methyl-accepting chemotaxis protein
MMLSLASWWRLLWPRLQAGEAASRAAGAATVVAADTVRPQVVAEVARGRRQVASRVAELRSSTEREILACGNVLSTIVDDVRELIAETERKVEATRARSKDVTERFIGEVQEDIQVQEAAVDQVLVLTQGMEEAVKAIDGLSQFSNILAINARIEAARLGDSGRGFAVIAEQMRELSKTIQGTAGKVASTIGAVRTGLPQVRERALSMQSRTRAFIDAVSDQVNSGSLQAAGGGAGESRLDAVIQLSNQALSHLQIQDPLAQGLTSIDRDFGVVEERVRRALNGEVLAALEAERPAAGDDAPARGEVTLF